MYSLSAGERAAAGCLRLTENDTTGAKPGQLEQQQVAFQSVFPML